MKVRVIGRNGWKAAGRVRRINMIVRILLVHVYLKTYSLFCIILKFFYTIALSNHIVLFALLSFCLKCSTNTEFFYYKNIAFKVTFFVCIYPIKLKWPEQSEQMKQSELNVQSLIRLKSFPRWHSYLKGFKLSAEYQTYCINSSKAFLMDNSVEMV